MNQDESVASKNSLATGDSAAGDSAAASIAGLPVDARRQSRRLVPRVCSSVLVLVLFGLLVPMPFSHGRLGSAVGDLCHFPIFFCVSLTVLWAWQRINPYASMTVTRNGVMVRMATRAVVVAVAVSIFGLAMEWLQSQTARSASWHDAWANSLGASAAGLVHTSRWIWRITGRDRWRIVGWGFAAGGLAIASYDPMVVIGDVMRVRGQFPMLADFERRSELGRWFKRRCVMRRSTDNVTRGKYSGEVRVNVPPRDGDNRPAKISVAGVTLFEMPRDWSRMSRLKVDVAIDPDADPEVDWRVWVKVVDGRGSHHRDGRHVGKLTPMRAGGNRTIELSRDDLLAEGLDLENIRYLDVQILDPPSDVTYRIDHARLDLIPLDTDRDTTESNATGSASNR